MICIFLGAKLESGVYDGVRGECMMADKLINCDMFWVLCW